ncbi:MAG: hypothetical protein ACEQSX_12890 [Baekduiaceae bacterium]
MFGWLRDAVKGGVKVAQDVSEKRLTDQLLKEQTERAEFAERALKHEQQQRHEADVRHGRALKLLTQERDGALDDVAFLVKEISTLADPEASDVVQALADRVAARRRLSGPHPGPAGKPDHG